MPRPLIRIVVLIHLLSEQPAPEGTQPLQHMVLVAQVHQLDEVAVEVLDEKERMAARRALGPAEAFHPPPLQVVIPAVQVADVERNVGQPGLVPGDGFRRQLRVEREDLAPRAPCAAYPADLAAAVLPFHAEERAYPLRVAVGHADQRAAEHLPVEPDRPVEVRHRDTAVAEGSRFHRSFWMMCSAVRSACATMVNPGLTAADEGKKDASTTKRFGTSWVRQNGSSTEGRGSAPNTSVPHWCVVLRLPCECLTTTQKPRRRRIRFVSPTRSRGRPRMVRREWRWRPHPP